MCAKKVLVVIFSVLYVSPLLADGYFRSSGVYITGLKVESDTAYVQVEGNLDHLTSASGNTCTVSRDGLDYSIKISLAGGGMEGGKAGGASSIVALLQVAQKAHLPVELWSYSPVGGYASGTNQTIIDVGSCSSLDADLPTINSVVM